MHVFFLSTTHLFSSSVKLSCILFGIFNCRQEGDERASIDSPQPKLRPSTCQSKESATSPSVRSSQVALSRFSSSSSVNFFLSLNKIKLIPYPELREMQEKRIRHLRESNERRKRIRLEKLVRSSCFTMSFNTFSHDVLDFYFRSAVS